MIPVAAWTAVAVLAALAVVQGCAALGAPWGRLLWGGRHRVLPTRLRVGSALSIALYGAFGWLLLSRAGIVAGGGAGFAVVATWVLFGYFALGILLNLASRSRPERWTMAPVCLVLATCTLLVALG